MRMMRLKSVLSALLLFGSFAAPLSAVEFSIKLSGGLARFERGAFDRVLNDWAEWQRLESESRNLWVLQSSEIKPMPPFVELEGELVCRIHRRWAVSAGIGLIDSEVDTNGAHLVITKSEVDNDIAHPQKVNAVPVILSVYHFLPIGKSIELYARAGAGWMSLDYYDQEASKKIENEKYGFSLDQNAGGDTTVTIAALGIKVDTPTGLSFLLEGGYRHAESGELTGDVAEGAGWTMYAFEQYEQGLDFWRYRHSLYYERPGGADVRNAEPLTIDLSGFSVRLGVMIRF